MVIESLQPFAISFLIGLIVGIERERSHPVGMQAMGVRTFILLALLGSIAGWLGNSPMAIIISAFALGIILLGYIRSTDKHRYHKNKEDEERSGIGITTEISAAIVFCLGFVSLQAPILAGAVGTGVLLVLVGRKRLHKFSREQLTPEEIRAATTMLVIALVFLPFLPNYTIDPWNLFNPQRFGELILIIATLQFGGYIAIRVFGQNLGIIMTGFFGGLVSSTAVFVTLPRLVKERPQLIYPAVTAGILATIGMLVELSIILLAVSPTLFTTLMWAILAMIGTGLLSIFLVTHNHIHENVIENPLNPLDLKLVLRLAGLIGGMIFLVALIKYYTGNSGMQLLAFLAGLFEVHGITLATANLEIQQQISLMNASVCVGIAVLASYITKFVILWSAGRNQFALLTSVFLSAMIAAGVGAEIIRLTIFNS